MKMFTKLALVSSIAISANAMAMQAMDDAALGATTGQAGLTVSIDTTGITIDKLMIHDNDGFTNKALTFGTGTGAETINTTGGAGADATGAAAIVVNDISIQKAASNTGNLVDLIIDSGVASGLPVLNVNAKTGAMDISIGSIGVATSGTYDSVTNTRGVTGTEKTIITGLSLSLGATEANIQLGNAPQGAMIVVDASITGGLTTSFSINDSSSTGGGAIKVDGLKLTTAGSSDLNADAKIGVTSAGLYITTASAPMNAYINGVTLGGATASSIGSVEVQGLDLGGTTIRIAGH